HMAFDCLQSIKKGEQWTVDHIDFSNQHRHLRTTSEMEELFGDFWLEALKVTDIIQQKCTVTIDFNRRMMPEFPVPHTLDAHTHLKNMCLEKVNEKYETVSNEVVERLTYELNVI